MLLHRMVETLDEGIVEFFSPALPPLLACADTREMQEVVTLLNQLVRQLESNLRIASAGLGWARLEPESCVSWILAAPRLPP